MNSITATLDGETVTIVEVTIDGINGTIVYIDSVGVIKTKKFMAIDGVTLATGALV